MTVVWNSANVEARIRSGANRGVVAMTERVLEIGNGLIANPPKTGIVYKRYNPQREHQASAPGEAPAADLGGLMASGSTSYSPQALRGTVNWSAEYARALELGTERIEPRPYARPALELAAPEFPGLVAAGIREELG
jgi:hypothetical protein